MKDECTCSKETLVSSLNSAIDQCGCGIYHIHIHPVTLHLNASQFESTARLFKLAMGITVGRRMGMKPVKSYDSLSSGRPLVAMGETVPAYGK